MGKREIVCLLRLAHEASSDIHIKKILDLEKKVDEQTKLINDMSEENVNLSHQLTVANTSLDQAQGEIAELKQELREKQNFSPLSIHSPVPVYSPEYSPPEYLLGSRSTPSPPPRPPSTPPYLEPPSSFKLYVDNMQVDLCTSDGESDEEHNLDCDQSITGDCFLCCEAGECNTKQRLVGLVPTYNSCRFC